MYHKVRHATDPIKSHHDGKDTAEGFKGGSSARPQEIESGDT